MQSNMIHTYFYSYHLVTVSDNCLFIVLFLSFPTVNDFYFGILSLPIDGFDHWKVVSYQFEYIVLDDGVGGYTSVIHFHTTMVNNKKQYFSCFW